MPRFCKTNKTRQQNPPHRRNVLRYDLVNDRSMCRLLQFYNDIRLSQILVVEKTRRVQVLGGSVVTLAEHFLKITDDSFAGERLPEKQK